MNMVFRIVRHPEDTEDVLQETLLKASTFAAVGEDGETLVMEWQDPAPDPDGGRGYTNPSGKKSLRHPQFRVHRPEPHRVSGSPCPMTSSR